MTLEKVNSDILVVDLDGTLVKTDTLIEMILLFLRQSPSKFLWVFIWIFQGRSRLKYELSIRVPLDPRTLPYNHEVLDYIKSRMEKGSQVVLATGATELVARSISNHLNIFKDVLSSSIDLNLTGAKKRDALISRYGKGKFDYIGNDSADINVWLASNRIILVNASTSTKKRILKKAQLINLMPVEILSNYQVLNFKAWIRALRLHQWSKNLLIFIPLILSHNLLNADMLLSSIKAFLAFGLCASATYVINDLLDLKDDRIHPTKFIRPFARGDIKITHGIFSIIALAFLSALLATTVNANFSYMLLIYAVFTLSYSIWIKRIVLLDVFMLAILYTLRIFSGSVAINISESLWLLSFSIFIFLSLALIKRYSELRRAVDIGKMTVNGRDYKHDDLPLLVSMGISSGSIAPLILLIYINNGPSGILYADPHVLWVIALIILFWIARVWLLALRNQVNDDPVIFALNDKVSIICAFFVALILMLAL